MTEPGFLDPAAWFAQLARVVASAGALITDPAGRALVVKPNYRPGWSLPGGVCEHGEPPHLACAREVLEEVGLAITPARLLVVHWLPPEGERTDPNIAFIFDGGTVDGPDGIRLQQRGTGRLRVHRPARIRPFPAARDRRAHPRRGRRSHRERPRLPARITGRRSRPARGQTRPAAIPRRPPVPKLSYPTL